MIDKEQVLNRWAAGVSANSLAKELGCSRGGIRKVIATAAQAGDPRAASHAHLAGANPYDNRPAGYAPKTRAYYTEIERKKRAAMIAEQETKP